MTPEWVWWLITGLLLVATGTQIYTMFLLRRGYRQQMANLDELKKIRESWEKTDVDVT